jgi:PHS family inorganic phosphate transporter-like MFS transporter
MSISLEIFAFFMLTGIFSTLLLPETKGKSLEELSNEDQDGFVRGMAKCFYDQNDADMSLNRN